MNNILTTDRPLNNEDRKTLWKDRQQGITSPPPQVQPQGVSFSSVIFGALGFVLAIGIPLVLVTLAADFMGLFE